MQMKAAGPARRLDLLLRRMRRRQRIGGRRAQHRAVEMRQRQRRLEQRTGAFARSPRSRRGCSRMSMALSSATCANRLSPPCASTPSISRSALSRNAVLAGKGGQPDQVLRDDGIRVRDRVVGGRGRPHHQPFGIVGGEIIGAGRRRWHSGGRAPPARSWPGRDSRASPVASNSASAAADHGGEVRGQPGKQQPALPERMPEPVVSGHVVAHEGEGAFRHRDPAGLIKCQPGMGQAPRSSCPFQSASTLSSRPGRTRFSRILCSMDRSMGSAASISMLRGKSLSLLRIL